MRTEYLVNLGKVDDIPLGQGICYIVKGEEIAVFRLRDGRIMAVQNRCPHAQGPLAEGVVGGDKVVCPLHGHKFDLSSGQGTEKGECVRTFKVWQQQGQLVLAFPCALLKKGSNNEECLLP